MILRTLFKLKNRRLVRPRSKRKLGRVPCQPFGLRICQTRSVQASRKRVSSWPKCRVVVQSFAVRVVRGGWGLSCQRFSHSLSEFHSSRFSNGKYRLSLTPGEFPSIFSIIFSAD